MATVFESDNCSRCGGSGHYSFCTMYGTICFKCKGSKRLHTKRGAAAYSYYTKLASKPAKDLQVGDIIWVVDGVIRKSAWHKVIDAHRGGSGSIIDNQSGGVFQYIDTFTVETEGMSYQGSANEPFHVKQSPEQYKAKMSLAIAFERSLNKAGNVDKRLAKLTSEVAWG